jgi:hypothetical protein
MHGEFTSQPTEATVMQQVRFLARLSSTVDRAVNSGTVRNVYPIFKVRVLGRSDEKSPAVTELVALTLPL